MHVFLFIRQIEIADDPIEIIHMSMMCVIALVILHIEKDVQAARSADRQSQDIDEAEGLVVAQIAESDFEEIGDHGVQCSMFNAGQWFERLSLSQIAFSRSPLAIDRLVQQLCHESRRLNINALLTKYAGKMYDNGQWVGLGGQCGLFSLSVISESCM